MQNTTRLKKRRRRRDKKACWTRHLDSCFRERGRGRETQGAGPTQRRSSQLRSREVTTASDKQSAIDHSSPRRSPAAEGRAVRQREGSSPSTSVSLFSSDAAFWRPFATGKPLKPSVLAYCRSVLRVDKEKTERKREESCLPFVTVPMHYTAKKKNKKRFNCSCFYEKTKKGHWTLTHIQAQDSVFIWAQCASPQKPQIIPPKHMCKEEQWGSPSFVCEPALLGFSICISRLTAFEAGEWQKHQSLQAHCVALTHSPHRLHTV